MFSNRICWASSSSIALLVDVLQKDQLVVGGSDTVVGFLAALTEKSKNLLDEAKGREEKPYIVLISSVEKLGVFVDEQQSAPFMPLITACWPGPLTVIFNAKKELPAYMRSPTGTIALRIPAHAGLQGLLEHFSGLFSTSANISGQPIPGTIRDLDSEIIKSAAYIVEEFAENGAGEPRGVPSTIVDCTGPRVRVVREGAYSLVQIRDYFPAK